MRRYLFSGSSFGRVEQCPPSAALPRVDTQTRHATDGSGIHEYLALLASGVERVHALALIPEPVREWAARIDADAVPRGLAERAVAYDPITGFARFTGDSARRYAIESGEIPMTPDLVVMDGIEPDGDTGWTVAPNATATVIDWKTTRFDHDPHYDLPQLEINGLAVAAVFGLASIGIAVCVINDDGAMEWTRRELDAEYLSGVAQRVNTAVGHVVAEIADRERCEAVGREYTPDVRRGHYCGYCGGFLACPATRTVLRTIADGVASVEAAPGAAYVSVQATERFADTARGVIKEIVRRVGPCDTGDGRVVTLDSRGSFKLRRA